MMTTESTASPLRPTGISVVGDVRWGTHFCYFYETKQDLLDALVLYFKAGLENNEFCLWVVSPPLTVEEAKRALAKAVPDLDRHLAEGDLKIHRHEEWYLQNGRCDPQRVLHCWCENLNEALALGYAGMRASGDGGWIQKDDWIGFREYEEEVNALVADQRRVILCTYPLTTTPGAQIFDVARIHQLAVARRHGRWEMVESPELKQAKAEIQRLNDQLEQKVAERTRDLATTIEALRCEIVERRLAEGAVKQAEDRIRLIIDTIPTMAWSVRPDGALDFINQRWLDYAGLSFEDAIAEPTRTMHPEDLSKVMIKWGLAMAAGESFEGEMRLRRADGEYRWFLVRTVPLFDAQGKIVKWYGTSADIEDRKRAERQSQVLIDAIPHQIWSGPPDGTLDYCNDRWRSHTGLNLEDLRGHGWQSMLHPDDRDRVLAAWRESVANGTPYEQEERHRGAGGTYRWFLSRGIPMRDAEGRIVRWYGTNTDIEDRRLAEEALRQTQAALARATRTTILGELTSTIAHEVNQPLGAVVTNAQASLRWLNGNSPNLNEAREALQRIIRDGNRASEVVARIRSLLKNGKPVKTRFSLDEMIEQTVALTEAEVRRRRVSLQTRLEPNLPHVIADRVQMQQVLLNLVMNALDALSEVTGRPRRLNIEVRMESSGAITVDVQDTGIGIEPERMKEVFEPFYTTKEDGLGLGLSISRSIIEAHGGRFEVTPNDGPGVRFSFTLPAGSARVQ